MSSRSIGVSNENHIESELSGRACFKRSADKSLSEDITNTCRGIYVLNVAVSFALRIIAIIITLHKCASAKNSQILFFIAIRQLAFKRVCTARDFSYHNFQATRFSDILNSSPHTFCSIFSCCRVQVKSAIKIFDASDFQARRLQSADRLKFESGNNIVKLATSVNHDVSATQVHWTR